MEAEELSERLIEAAAALLLAAENRQLNITNLNKALFYFDLYALRDLGKPVTHTTFLALDQGPVVAKYDKRLVKALKDSGIALQSESGNAKPVHLKQEPSWKYLTDAERKLATEIGSHISQMSASTASNFSHKNPGWKLASEEGLGAQKSAMPIHLNIALQQILDEDPWIHEEPTDATNKAVEIAERGEGEVW